MANSKIIDSKVLQELTNKLQDIINNYCWNFENYSDEDIESLFDGTGEEISYYSSLIKDDQVSKNFLHSSKQIADDIAKAILDANEYSENLIKNISTIKLSYVTSLPTSDISENTIYILKAVDGTSNDTLNLYNETNGWTNIGEFNISLDDYYTKNETDNLLNDKIDKTSIGKTIDENSSDDEIPTSKAVNDRVANLKTSVEISYTDYLALSDEEKNNGVAYYIPDLPVSTSGEIIGDVEYGVFVNSVDTIPLVGDIIPISTKLQGNIKYDNGYMLKNGKTYNINIVVDGYTTSDVANAHIRYSLNFGSTTLTEGIAIPNRSTSNWGESQVSFVYTPTENGVLTIKCGSIQNISGLVTGFSKVTITEIPSYKGLIDVSDEHIKEVATSLNCSWHTKDISLSSNLTAWGNESITVSEIINSKKVMLYDGTNQVWTSIFENIGEVMNVIYTNGLGATDGYNFSQKIIVDFTNGNIMNVSMRTLTSTGNPPNFTKIAYYK